MGAMLCNRTDGAGIGKVIAFGICLSAGRFAQHIVTVGETFGLHPFCTLHGFADIFAKYKLTAHFAHRAGYGAANNRFTQPLYGTAQMAGETGLFVIQNTPR